MAKINIEEMIKHLDVEFRKALDLTIREHFPNQEFNSKALFKTFTKEATNKCNSWERIPNKYIRSD